jgi:membrane peptidoglycan carboxypeptidase
VPNFTLGIDEVTPLGMSSAYGVFANHGTLCQPIAITSVVNRANKALAVPASNCKRVMSRAVADSVTSVLSQVIDGPLPGRTGQKMSLGRDAAGKTGTTNSSASVWFVGFTPDLAAAVATFDARGVGGKYAMQNLTIGGHYFGQVFGSTLPGPIWKMAMLSALDGTPKTQFDLKPLDGLGTYVPPPPGKPCGTAASPSPGGTVTPFPGASPTVCPSRTPSPSGSPSPGTSGSPTPKPSTGPTPKPSTTPSPKPSGT